MYEEALRESIPGDNTTLIDFLVTSASVLATSGQLAGKELDSLRLTLTGIQAQASERSQPLMQALVAHDNEFLVLLAARYGEAGLTANLLRYGLRQELAELISVLSRWGEALIDKAKLVFNRPFYLYNAQHCERRVLYATLLVDFSKILADACQRLTRIRDEINQLLAHSMASSDEAPAAVDEELAKALGFTGVCNHSMPGMHDELLRAQIGPVLGQVAAAVAELRPQFEQPTASPASIRLGLLADLLAFEGQRLASLGLPRQGNLASFDVKRRLILASVHALAKGCSQLQLAFEQTLATLPPPAEVLAYAPGADVERRMLCELVAQGSGVRQAKQAVSDLLSYLKRNELAPADVLVAELNKINPCLTPHCLRILQELGEINSLAKVALAEKQRTLRQSTSLRQEFSEHLARLTPALLLVMGLFGSWGCGVKLNPISKRLDYRPDLPLTAAPPPAPPKAQVPKG